MATVLARLFNYQKSWDRSDAIEFFETAIEAERLLLILAGIKKKLAEATSPLQFSNEADPNFQEYKDGIMKFTDTDTIQSTLDKESHAWAAMLLKHVIEHYDNQFNLGLTMYIPSKHRSGSK